MNLDEIINENREYIKRIKETGSKFEKEQYLDTAEVILIHLEGLREGKQFPNSFYWALLDGFDIRSKFFSHLSYFFEENEDKLSP